MRILTIGFTKKTAERFFGALKSAGAKRIVDVRLNNVSQLAGFAKKNDLAFFLDQLCGAGYVHISSLAPTKDMLDEYKKRGGDWPEYEKRFLDLMEKRSHREDSRARDLQRRLFPVQRGQAASLPSTSCCRIPARSLG